MSDLKKIIQEMVGQPIPEEVMKSIDWEALEGISGKLQESRIKQIVEDIRSSEGGENVLLG